MSSDAPPLRRPRHKADPDYIRLTREQELYRKLRREPLVERWFERTEGGSGHVLMAQRRHVLSSSLRITAGVSPYLHKVLSTVKKLLRIEGRVELYVSPSPQINAFCMPLPEGALLLVMSSAAVEHFTQHELLFVVGHEIGHGLLGHYQFPAMSMVQPDHEDDALPWNTCMEVLSWSRASEVSADRMGLLCCQSAEVATRAFLKLASGLPSRFLGDGDDFDGQMDEWVRDKVAGEGLDDTHPLHSIRVQCARSFTDSEYFTHMFGDGGAPPKFTAEAADAEALGQLATMDADPTHIERLDHPEDQMEFLTLCGFLLIAADGQISPVEYHWLSGLVGEEPAERVQAWAAEVGLDGVWQEIQQRGGELAGQLDRRDCFGLLEEIAVIAAVDGHIDSSEVQGIQMIAGAMNLPSNLADVAIRNLKGAKGDVHQFA
ncbi:MAG: hypothetical protein CL910_21620 [Deltaproteobacteria bacterium]|nr:hypothetical protein [Deltaproteobacteria bacterium]